MISLETRKTGLTNDAFATASIRKFRGLIATNLEGKPKLVGAFNMF